MIYVFQILDLFSLENAKSKKSKSKSGNEYGSGASCGAGIAPRDLLDNIPELWDQSEYHDEYDLDKFLATIAK